MKFSLTHLLLLTLVPGHVQQGQDPFHDCADLWRVGTVSKNPAASWRPESAVAKPRGNLESWLGGGIVYVLTGDCATNG